jgi:ethanolamine ammonia-lyase large subunit
MVAAVSKIMRVQDLVLVAQKIRVVTKFRGTLGLRGRLSTRLQPNHPTDEPAGIAASILDGLLYGNGDAMIGINPATDSIASICAMLEMLDAIIQRYEIPTQACVLTHVTTSIEAINRGVPLDLVFQSIAGTEAANASFGINLNILQEGYDAGLSLNRGTLGQNLMYFETGQGSALSANAHHGVDQQTCETRAYAVARHFKPFLVNTVVGFIGPEYLYNGKQIIRAGLEDHFCGKLLGVPMGCDICYTNHAEADQDDMDTLLTLLGVAGINFIMGIPGSDDIMLNYQTTSFHDALYARQTLGLKPAPEFEQWLAKMGIFTQADGKVLFGNSLPPAFRQAWRNWDECINGKTTRRSAKPMAGTAPPDPGADCLGPHRHQYADQRAAGFPIRPRPGPGRGALAVRPCRARRSQLAHAGVQACCCTAPRWTVTVICNAPIWGEN